jgi:hypothetical protein
MEIIFTRQNGVISKLIRKITGEEVSHVAFIYMQNVYHSTHAGAAICTLKKFREKSEIVHRVKLPKKYDLCFHYRFAQIEGATYDLPAAIYAGWRILLNKTLGLPIPELNKFNFKDAYICTELAQKILKIEEGKILTPFQLYQKCRELFG